MTTTAVLQEAFRDKYQALHDVLRHAHEVSTNDLQTRELRSAADSVQAVLTALDRADLQSHTAQFEAAGKQIVSVNADMSALKAEIGHIVQDAALANKIVSAIDSAASAAAKLLA